MTFDALRGLGPVNAGRAQNPSGDEEARSLLRAAKTGDRRAVIQLAVEAGRRLAMPPRTGATPHSGTLAGSLTLRAMGNYVFSCLQAAGWTLSSPTLKVRHATSPDGSTTLWLKPEVVLASGGKVFKNARHFAPVDVLVHEIEKGRFAEVVEKALERGDWNAEHYRQSNPFEFLPAVAGGVVGGVAYNLLGDPMTKRIRNVLHGKRRANPAQAGPGSRTGVVLEAAGFASGRVRHPKLALAVGAIRPEQLRGWTRPQVAAQAAAWAVEGAESPVEASHLRALAVRCGLGEVRANPSTKLDGKAVRLLPFANRPDSSGFRERCGGCGAVATLQGPGVLACRSCARKGFVGKRRNPSGDAEVRDLVRAAQAGDPRAVVRLASEARRRGSVELARIASTAGWKLADHDGPVQEWEPDVLEAIMPLSGWIEGMENRALHATGRRYGKQAHPGMQIWVEGLKDADFERILGGKGSRRSNPDPLTASLLLVGNPSRPHASRPLGTRTFRKRNDGGFKMILPAERVKGAISFAEAQRRWPKQIAVAEAAFKDFHGGADPSDDVILYDDGRKDVQVAWVAGRSPEVTYGGAKEDVPDGSVKSDALYVHKTNEEAEKGKGPDRPTYLIGLVPKKGANSSDPVTKDFMLIGSMIAKKGWLRK